MLNQESYENASNKIDDEEAIQSSDI